MSTALDNLDMGQRQLLNALIHPLTADPGSPAAGQVWFRSDVPALKFYDGTTVQTIADLSDVAGAGGGDMLIATYDPQGVDGDAFARANHTGTQAAATISDFAAAVAALTLDADTLEGSDLATVLAAARDRSTHTGTNDADTLEGSTSAQLQSTIVAAITDSAPGTLDTLNELAAALGDDPNYAATTTAAIAAKAAVQSSTIGDGATTALAVAHGATDADGVAGVTLRETSSGDLIPIADISIGATNITVTITPAPSTDEYTLTWTA